MYRVDGRSEDYRNLLSIVEKASVDLDGYTKEELQIEKCKFLIATFDFSLVLEEIDKINHVWLWTYNLRKYFYINRLVKMK